MPPRHVGLAVVLAFVWGVNFVAVDIGLRTFPPLLFVALRFALTAFPAIFLLPRPRVALRDLAGVGLFLGALQFGFVFVSIDQGMPAGLASLVLQLQVVFTILLAMAFLGERPHRLQLVGAAVALMGLMVIAATRTGDGVPLEAIALCLAGALSWAIGNVFTRHAGATNALALIAWSSLIALAPLIAASFVLEGTDAARDALGQPSAEGVGALLFGVVFATAFGFGAWTWLLGRHPASRVVPFALLVPVSGIASAWIVLGEQPTAAELAGAVLIVLGLAVVVRAPRDEAVATSVPRASV
jgi:O-acetylserine/cysteine efflux transporter